MHRPPLLAEAKMQSPFLSKNAQNPGKASNGIRGNRELFKSILHSPYTKLINIVTL